jgi:thioredoxin-dependent peroxiredoxin
MLSVNDEAPDFTATLSDGSDFRLSEYRDKKNVVLYFYPKDFSLGCTKQASLFTEEYAGLQQYNCEIFGVSYDAMDRHAEFIRAYRLPFRLISDADKAIARLYDVTRFGGYLPFVKRVSYVIDTNGTIRNVIHHEFRMENHVAEIRQTLQNIQHERIDAE